MRFVLLFALASCISSGEPGVDASDMDPPSPCCKLLPDEDAVRSCAGPFTPGTCGVIACPADGGGFTRINFCGPMSDGGVP